jgi:hypothetical protein
MVTIGGLLVLSNLTLVATTWMIGNTHNCHQDLFHKDLSISLRVVH